MEENVHPFHYSPTIVKEFIETYEFLPELWDSKHSQYLNKTSRNAALDVLLKVLQKANPVATKADVRKKINTLRSNYRRELKKIFMSRTSASTDDDVYQPSSWTFYSLTFLDSGDANESQDVTILPADHEEIIEEIELHTSNVKTGSLQTVTHWTSQKHVKNAKMDEEVKSEPVKDTLPADAVKEEIDVGPTQLQPADIVLPVKCEPDDWRNDEASTNIKTEDDFSIEPKEEIKDDNFEPLSSQIPNKSELKHEKVTEADLASQREIDNENLMPTCSSTVEKTETDFKSSSGIKVPIIECNSPNTYLAENRNYECSVCSKRFKKRKNYEKHIMTHIEEQPHVCSICHKRFKRKSFLKDHLKRHAEKNRYQCSACSNLFTRKYSLLMHIRRKHIKHYKCRVCQRVLITQDFVYISHIITNHPEEEPYAYECKVCKEKFNTECSLAEHRISVHDYSKNRFECPECSLTFNSKWALFRHKNLHPMRHKCSMCNKTIQGKDNYSLHMKEHARYRTYKGKVRVCFNSDTDIYRRKTSHEKDFPYECFACRKQFISKDDLTIHNESMHKTKNTTKPLTCAGVNSVRDAFKSYTVKKPHQCSMCEKCFSTKSNIAQHMKIVHGHNL